MYEFLHTNPILHGAYHSVIIFPILYFAYLLMEFIEHKTSTKFQKALSDDRRTGPIVGATLGLLPLCGFSDLGAGFYACKVISVGTLVALFVSTSGEILLLFTSYSDKILPLLFLLLVKFVIACICGFGLDLYFRNKQSELHIHDLCEEADCKCEHSNIWFSALKHTLPVFCLVLSFNILFGILEVLGLVKSLAVIIKSLPAFNVFITAFIGFIPGCSSLILMLYLWNSGIISSAAFLAGLITSAGTGYLVLYKTNKAWKQNLFITLFIFIIGFGLGSIFELSGLFIKLGI